MIGDELNQATSTREKRAEELNQHRDSTYSAIDAYFETLVARLMQRRDELKESYRSIEGRERRRMKREEI
jgi:hypothetical protein